MKIKRTGCDLYGRPIEMAGRREEEVRLSFIFDDGDNWHFQLKNNATKAELKEALSGVVKLIDSK